MPLVKLWNADRTIKKVAQASSLEEVLAQAKEKGICNAANAKVFLQDWTELEEETFAELLHELPLNDRVFIVAEVIPAASPDPFLSGIPEHEAPSNAATNTFDITNMSPPPLDTSNFPSSLREALGSQVPLHPRERRDLVRRVADNLLNLYSRPKREEIRSTAAQIVAAYPLSLQDRKLDGGLLGRGYDSFFQQLENRIENLNRGKRSASPTAGVSGSKVRKWAYGCANWQPVRRFEPPNDTQEKIQFMKQEGRKNYKEINMTLATQYMQDTYIEQRTFINTDPCPHTSKVKEEWPLLFITPCFYKHADQLLGKDVKIAGSIFKKDCYIAAENQLLFSEGVDFVEATCLLFLTYYVLNMSYAEGAATTLEFLQRYRTSVCSIH
ncbi:uncharacterized protein [Dermacentor andersoni]|uniref:uncharacterized protein n=1 Tax=Dermacentor andersoni TaxID=34620 RepID=UPI003B3AA173